MKAKIKEIFISTQGEGPFVGYKQMFIRFCGCNLKCNYCDTDFDAKDCEEYTTDELLEKIKTFDGFDKIHSISLTGGEPLLWTDFLSEFLTRVKKPIYLETNATITKGLNKVFDNIDYVSADIKLPSSSGIKNSFELHDEFFKAVKCAIINCAMTKQYDCYKQRLFAKIVFDENITEGEIKTCAEIGNEFDIELVLQPKMIGEKMSVNSDFCNELLEKFTTLHHNTRLIPQVHKFLDVR